MRVSRLKSKSSSSSHTGGTVQGRALLPTVVYLFYGSDLVILSGVIGKTLVVGSEVFGYSIEGHNGWL